jgi:isoleucyl-tRNA synthetase
LEQNVAELPFLLIVSQVEISAGPPDARAQPLALAASLGEGTVHAEIRTAAGQKCPRCWTYSEVVGTTRDVCDKCAVALAG